MPTPRPKNIYRVDREYTHAYYVRFERNGTNVERMFSDNVFGSKALAKKAAYKFRNEYRKDNPMFLKNRVTARNSIGIVGVIDAGDAYRAYWYVGKKRCNQQFSKQRYGATKALAMARYAQKECRKIEDPKNFLVPV